MRNANTHSAWVLALATTRVRFVIKNSARTLSCRCSHAGSGGASRHLSRVERHEAGPSSDTTKVSLEHGEWAFQSCDGEWARGAKPPKKISGAAGYLHPRLNASMRGMGRGEFTCQCRCAGSIPPMSLFPRGLSVIANLQLAERACFS